MIRLPRRSLALIAVPAVISMSGCGGTSDKDQINSIITDEGANPPSLCDHVTDAVLQRLGGSTAACKQVARRRRVDLLEELQASPEPAAQRHK